MKKILFFVLTLLVCFGSYEVEAQLNEFEMSNASQKADASFLSEFYRVAISDTKWFESGVADTDLYFQFFIDNYPDLSDPKVQQAYKAMANNYPGLEDFIYYPEGFPKTGVINKWDGEITIGIGWPSFGRNEIEDADETILIMEEQIKKLAPELQDLTGLPVRYIEYGSEEDRSDDYAKVRIVPIEHTGLWNFFKTLRRGVETYSPYAPTLGNYYSARFWGGVPFTPYSRSQVDGYFLPNSDNTIGFSLCYISEKISNGLQRALVTECLTRALGLPDALELERGSVVNEWNQAYDKKSKTPVLDGDMGSRLNYTDLFSGRFKHNYVDGLSGTDSYISLREYDKKMIKLLYCDAVKPGMDVYELAKVFSDNTCNYF